MTDPTGIFHNPGDGASMVDLRRVALLSLAVVSASASFAQGQTTLRYKYKEGDTFTYEAEQNTKAEMISFLRTVRIVENMAVEMTCKVIKVNDKGDADVAVQFSAVKIAMDTPDDKVAVSSTAAGKPDSSLGQKLYAAVKVISKLQATGKQSATGELTDVKISEESLKELKKSTDGLGGEMFNGNCLKNLVGALGLVLPTEAIAKGKTWIHTTSLKLDIGNSDVKLKYTYEGADNGLESISLSSALDIKPRTDLPFELKVKTAKGKGTAKFDNQVGRLRELSMTQHVEMEVKSGDISFESTQTIETKVKLSK
jgi:hypothetical protein